MKTAQIIERLENLLPINHWDFIETNYPDYSKSDKIMESNLLQAILDGESNPETEAEYREKYGNDIAIESVLLDIEIYIEALKNSIEHNEA